VETTQGGRDVDAYRDSIVSGLIFEKALLEAEGIRPDSVRDVLDVGCGTGRLLVGWHCDDSRRRLLGVDIDAELIAWNRDHLRGVAEWKLGTLSPTPDLPDHAFDLVQLVSVFTHLSLECQREWVVATRRLLRPGGIALVTLHGDTYARLLLDPVARDSFERTGYVELPAGTEGGQGFATFHSSDFARDLFSGFGGVAHYPRGVLGDGPPRLFPIASLQDVYVLRGQTMS
jgi:SAM-dependent methyltransferase